jgi:hypothetical protein
MYIDKFAKVPTGDGTYNKKIELNSFLNNNNRRKEEF